MNDLQEGSLLSIAGFWKNDQPDGVGVQILCEAFSVPLEVIWREIMESWQKMWDEEDDKDQLVLHMTNQIRVAGSHGVSLEESLIVLGNIWLLERYGYIKADEFNGMQFASLNGRYTAVPRRD